MEDNMNSKDEDLSIKTGLFNHLTEAYRCFFAGLYPQKNAADVASVIYSVFRGPVHGKDREGSPPEYCGENNVELTCICMSFLERISSSLTSQGLHPDVTFYYAEVLKVLFEDMDLITHLVNQFQAKDHIISHLAAKTASQCVFYLIRKSHVFYLVSRPNWKRQMAAVTWFCQRLGDSGKDKLPFKMKVEREFFLPTVAKGVISPVWQRKCEQAFQNSWPGTELDACLWSLTEVSKKLLKGAHQELMTLLAGFDYSLSVLCSKLLPEEKKRMSQYLVDFTRSTHWGTSFCLLLDLLEVLTSSTLVCGAGVRLKSQRITHLHSLALLNISCSSEYYVKKRVLLLLKRAILQKAGEDWTSGDVVSGMTCGNWSSDMSVLARTVLKAASDNWLQSIQMESGAFFGGTRCILGDQFQNLDCVMLRAVSLIILKSIELCIQTAAGSGVETAAEVYAYLQCLWGFLRRCRFKQREVTHLCCWISMLFGEQDDDMMEAAKALLYIFLHYRLVSGMDDCAVLETACASGFNPHCHFVLLLQSMSFDYSILLDFLISAETCFLEYFVQYLKCLRDDWQGFTAACGGIHVSACCLSQQKSALCGADRLPLKYKGEPDKVGSGSCVQPTDVITPAGRFGMASELRLVDYDTSDESDPENTVESVCALNGKRYKSPGLLSKPNSTVETRPEGLLQPVLQGEKTSHTNMTSLSWQVTGEISVKAVLCLSQLREVVTRLHTKKLFPYNPSSLLKLLAQVESCYQKSRLSQFNK